MGHQQRSTARPAGSPFLGASEAAALFGMSVNAFLKHVRKGHVGGAFRMGRRWYFYEDALALNPVPTSEQ
jgi:hypothetical protein